jgi:hypothetical protein
MRTHQPRERREGVPEELLTVLVDRAVRHIHPVATDADLEEVRAAVRAACENDPVLLLLLRT